MLLISGASLDAVAVDRLCHTALHIAAKNGHLEVAKALIAANANVNALNNFGWKASDLATEWGTPPRCTNSTLSGRGVSKRADSFQTVFFIRPLAISRMG